MTDMELLLFVQVSVMPLFLLILNGCQYFSEHAASQYY